MEVPLSVKEEKQGESDKVSSIVLNEYDISVIKQVIEKDYNVYEINITLDEKTLLKSARAFLIVKALEDSGDIIKIYPSTEDIENENFDLDFTAIYVSKKTDTEVYESIIGISEVASVQVKFLNDSFKEKLEIKPTVKVEPKPVTEKSKQATVNKVIKKEEKKPTQHKKVHQSVRVDLERLDKKAMPKNA